MKLVDCKNYYNIESFNELCQILEVGEEVEVYIDCIGHSRNNMEQESYKESLLEKYKSNLEVNIIRGSYSYSYRYKLKRVKLS